MKLRHFWRNVFVVQLLMVAFLTVSAHAAGIAAYIRGENKPWGVSTNEQAMTTVFGAVGVGWDDLRMAGGSGPFLPGSGYKVIYLEGGDSTAIELNNYLSANLPAIQTWVQNGGRLLLNSAPNQGGNINFGFGGVMLTNGVYIGSATATDPSHPIFQGPYLPVGTTFTGSYFSHAIVGGGSLIPLINETGNPANVALAELRYGAGKVLFGGMTPTYFHSPETQAYNLRTNILSYLAKLCKVGIYYADSPEWPVDVQNKINATGLFSQVDLHNVGSTTPTLTELQGYDSVLVYSNPSFADSTALGNVLADYADAGGGVVMATFAFWDPGYGYGLAISGRILNDGYLPFTVNTQGAGTALTLVPDLLTHPILAGVNTFSGGSSSYHNTISLATGASQVAHWSNGIPLVATKQPTTGKIVGLNFFPPSSDARGDFWDASTDGGRLMGNALNWACGGGGSAPITFTVTPSAGTGGSIDPATPQTVTANQTTSFTVNPNTGYHIAEVSGCGGSLSGNTYTTGPITADCTVSATFAIDTFIVTPNAGPGGSLSPATPQTVNYNNTTSFTVTPNPHYHLVSVSGCGGSLSGSTYTTGAITSACTVSATFAIDTFTVTPNAGPGGSLSPATPQTVNYNNTTSFTVTPNPHYHVVSVSGCGGSLSGSTYTTGAITAACTVTAAFAIDTFAVTPSAGTNGTISPNTPQIVAYNQATSFTLTPEKYFRIDSVSGCNGTLNGTVFTTGPITAACSVTASFYPTRTTVVPSFLSVSPTFLTTIGYVNVSWGISSTPGAIFELERSSNGGEFQLDYRGTNYSWRVAAVKLGKGSHVYRVRAVAPKYAPSSWKTSLPVVVK